MNRTHVQATIIAAIALLEMLFATRAAVLQVGQAGIPWQAPEPRPDHPEQLRTRQQDDEAPPDGAVEEPESGPVPPGIEVEVDLPELIEAHNRIRAEHDLPPLKPNPALGAAARVHAIDMAANDFMAHEGSDGSSPADRLARQDYPYQKVGENVAEGQRTVDSVMKDWMNSPHHRENILGTFEEIGAARATDAEGQPYWAVAFATARPELDPDAAAQDLVDAINARRKDDGKPALQVDPRLMAVAMANAQANADRGELDRDGSQGGNPLQEVAARGYRFRRLAMAVAAGQPTADEVVQTWIEEGGQQENLLGSFSDVGPGYATDKTGRPYWTVILGLPLRRR